MSDAPLSTAARDVLAALEAVARRHPDAGKPVLAWYLALRYCPKRLRRKHRARRLP